MRKEAKPVIKQLYIWLKTEKDNPANVGLIAKAIHYTYTRWHELCRYVNNPRLEIDNNLIENAIRPLALGRKNYLFAGNHAAAENYAHFYTVFGTCKKLDINPSDYLMWFLERIQETKINELHLISPMAYMQKRSIGET